MNKLGVNSIKLFLNEPMVEFSDVSNKRVIKSISMLNEEESRLVKDAIVEKIIPKISWINSKIVRVEKDIEPFSVKLNRIISQRPELTDIEIGARAGISSRQVHNLRRGKITNPTRETIYKLAKALQCDVVELI